MNNYKAMGSVTYKLLDYINSATKEDINYEIATIMLKNFSKVKEMNITDIAELCFVSPATISRFFRQLGFDNFSEFKEIASFNYPLQKDYSNKLIEVGTDNIKEAVEEYTKSLTNNINYALDNLDYEVLDRVIKAINESEKVGYFGAQFLQSVGKHLQSKLILMDKYIEAYSFYEKQLKCARNLNKDSLAIIVSVEGSYFFKYMDIVESIKESGAKIVVITQNKNSKLADMADELLICGNSNSNNEGRTIVFYLIELLAFRYSVIYNKR